MTDQGKTVYNNVPVVEIPAEAAGQSNLFLRGETQGVTVEAGSSNHAALVDAFMKAQKSGNPDDGRVVVRFVLPATTRKKIFSFSPDDDDDVRTKDVSANDGATRTIERDVDDARDR